MESYCRYYRPWCVFSDWRVGDFVDQNNNEHRHIIPFETSAEPNGFQIPDADQMGYVEGWQFSVQPDIHYYRGRVHGALVDDTFFLVWLDPGHLLFPETPNET